MRRRVRVWGEDVCRVRAPPLPPPPRRPRTLLCTRTLCSYPGCITGSPAARRPRPCAAAPPGEARQRRLRRRPRRRRAPAPSSTPRTRATAGWPSSTQAVRAPQPDGGWSETKTKNADSVPPKPPCLLTPTTAPTALPFLLAGVSLLVDPWLVGNLVFAEADWLYKGSKRDFPGGLAAAAAAAEQADAILLTMVRGRAPAHSVGSAGRSWPQENADHGMPHCP